jgi:hypothetical protein
MIGCLENIVGLSSSPCNCWDSSKPTNFATVNESKSGLYIASPDKIPLTFTNSAADCENGGVWELLVAMRQKAIKEFQVEYSKNLKHFNTIAKPHFTGYIGNDTFNLSLNTNRTYQAIELEPIRVKGGKMVIRGFQFTSWSGGAGQTIQVKVIRRQSIIQRGGFNNDDVLATGNISITSDRLPASTTLTTPLEIDLTYWDDTTTTDRDRIYVVYELPSGVVPVNNKLEKGCGCAGKANHYKENGFLYYMKARGIEVANLDDLNNPIYSNAHAKGLRIQADIYCDTYSWMCDLSYNFDNIVSVGGQDVDLGMTVASLIQSKAVSLVADALLTSSRINYYTMLRSEDLYRIRNKNIKEFNEGMAWLTQNLPIELNDCLVCKQNKLITKSRL